MNAWTRCSNWEIVMSLDEAMGAVANGRVAAERDSFQE